MEVDQIYLGDAFKLSKEVKDESVDLVLTSPPYGIGKSYEKRSKTIDEYAQTFIPICKECVRVLKKDGAIAWEVVEVQAPEPGD